MGKGLVRRYHLGHLGRGEAQSANLKPPPKLFVGGFALQHVSAVGVLFGHSVPSFPSFSCSLNYVVASLGHRLLKSVAGLPSARGGPITTGELPTCQARGFAHMAESLDKRRSVACQKRPQEG